MNFSEYTTFSKSQLLFRLGEIHENLANVYPEIAITKAEDLKQKLLAWQQSRATTNGAKNDEAKYATTVTTSSLYELEAQEKYLLEEKFYLLTLLNHA